MSPPTVQNSGEEVSDTQFGGGNFYFNNDKALKSGMHCRRRQSKAAKVAPDCRLIDTCGEETPKTQLLLSKMPRYSLNALIYDVFLTVA